MRGVKLKRLLNNLIPLFFLPWIFKFDKSERLALTVVKVNVEYFAVFVEDILEVPRSYVRRQVTHVDLVVVVRVRSSRHGCSSRPRSLFLLSFL